ncbi:MAG: energy-coupling factor transporter ATPase [Firmicutes bacterium]|nr:energy-coupling factor transporter ATPase [Bacillota bacterium]
MSIRVENLSHIYMPGTPMESVALEGISLEIKAGEFVGLIGETGSGKSTLIQHFNGLLKPTAGKVYVNGIDIGRRGTSLKDIRRRVGLVFQYPEHQLFEETVHADIAYGPSNMGLEGEALKQRVREAMTMVGIDYEELKDRSPFELSGGQMRRVAMAGVLAMKPEVLILDEPTAGLDPRGREEILQQIKALHREFALTVVLVSHSMEDVARLVERLLVMHRGKLVLTGPTREIFARGEELKKMGLGVPQVTELFHHLQGCFPTLKSDVLTVEEAHREIGGYLQRKRGKVHA